MHGLCMGLTLTLNYKPECTAALYIVEILTGNCVEFHHPLHALRINASIVIHQKPGHTSAGCKRPRCDVSSTEQVSDASDRQFTTSTQDVDLRYSQIAREGLSAGQHANQVVIDPVSVPLSRGAWEYRIMREFFTALQIPNLEPMTDFFAAGGDSLSAASVANTLGIAPLLLYGFPSARKLAAHLALTAAQSPLASLRLPTILEGAYNQLEEGSLQRAMN